MEKQPRLILHCQCLGSVAESVEWYESNIDNIIGQISEKHGFTVGISSVNFY